MNKLTHYETTPTSKMPADVHNPQTFPHIQTHTVMKTLSYSSKSLHGSPLERQTCLTQLLGILFLTLQLKRLHRLRQSLLHILLIPLPQFHANTWLREISFHIRDIRFQLLFCLQFLLEFLVCGFEFLGIGNHLVDLIGG